MGFTERLARRVFPRAGVFAYGVVSGKLLANRLIGLAPTIEVGNEAAVPALLLNRVCPWLSIRKRIRFYRKSADK